MPPRAVRSIRDLLFWQYAKIISESAGAGKKNFAFVMDRFNKLRTGEISWSSSIREYVKEREKPDECIYCGAKADLTLEHILPRSHGGPDTPENAIWVCKRCNSSKGHKRLYEWIGLEDRYDVPRIAEGKYLKLLFSLHDRAGTLGTTNINELCTRCNMQQLCPEKAKLTVYCLEGLFQ